MKLAILSDVHGNVPALEAVLADIDRWRPDEVIVNGDLVSRGPCSLACMKLLQSQTPHHRPLRGNHEEFVLDCADRPPAPQRPDYVLRSFADWTRKQLGDAVESLRVWPDHLDLHGLEGPGSVHITHGSRLGIRDGIKPETEELQLRRKLGARCALFVGSHTHRPMVRALDDTLVVNSGSVGQPLDRDPRACYARCEFAGGRWHATISRVAYDKLRAERDFVDSGFLEQCGPLARLIYLEHRHNRMLVGSWMGRYGAAVAGGELNAATMVDEFLRQMDLG